MLMHLGALCSNLRQLLLLIHDFADNVKHTLVKARHTCTLSACLGQRRT
jgi:hypothetical protein